MTAKKPAKKPALFSAAEFEAALTRQWQRLGLQSANEMTPYQWWLAVSAAVNEQVAARRAEGLGAARGNGCRTPCELPVTGISGRPPDAE